MKCFCQFDNCNCAQCFAGTSHPPKKPWLPFFGSGMWNFTSLVCRVDARPHRAQKDACTALVSSENPAHLRQKCVKSNLIYTFWNILVGFGNKFERKFGMWSWSPTSQSTERRMHSFSFFLKNPLICVKKCVKSKMSIPVCYSTK